MAKRGPPSIVACVLRQSLALLLASGQGSGHVLHSRLPQIPQRPLGHVLDSRLLQTSPRDAEAGSGGHPVLEALNGGRPEGHFEERVRLPAPKQATWLDPPGTEFTQCGELWEQFEPVTWSRIPDSTSYVACAPVTGGDTTIGICRTDGRGHHQWGYCKAAPPTGCNGLGKLWFVFCADLQRQTTSTSAPPTPAPTPAGAAGSQAPPGLVVGTVPPTLEPTGAPTPVPPTPQPTAAPTPEPTFGPRSITAPTAAPSPEPTAPPTAAPTLKPSPAPTALPTAAPTAAPSPAPTPPPTAAPTAKPSPAPTAAAPLPTAAPTAAPSPAPTEAAGAAQAPTPSPSAAPAPAAATGLAPTPAPTPLVITLSAPIAAGTTSISMASTDGLSVGDCFQIEGGGNSEVVCIACFGSILLTRPTANAYPAGSTITLLDVTSTAAPVAAGSGDQLGRSDTASVQDDPHVCTLRGECYDIREPSEYVLLRVPHRAEEPDMLKVTAVLETDGVRPCGLYVKSVVLSGSWLDHQAVRVRPYTRSAGGPNGAGAAKKTNFSMQLANSSWRSFSPQDSHRQLATVGRVTIRFVLREQYGHRMEAQSLEFLVGAGGRPAVLTVSQASHQALNLGVGGLRRLGFARLAGVLGTEGHAKSIERPSRECRAWAAGPAVDPDGVMRGQKPGGQALAENASTLSASWW